LRKLVRDSSRTKKLDLLKMPGRREMSSFVSSTSNVRKRKLSVARPSKKRMLLRSIKSVSKLKWQITRSSPRKTDLTISRRVREPNKSLITTDKRFWKSKNVKLKVSTACLLLISTSMNF